MEDKFYSLLSDLSQAIEGVKSEKDMLIRLIIAVVVFALFTVFRKRIADFAIFIINKTAARKSERAQNAVRNSLKDPVAFLSIMVGAYIGSEIIAPTGEIRKQLLVALKLFIIIAVGWAAINFINSDFSLFLSDDSSKSKKTAVGFMGKITKVIIIAVVVLLILEQFGISASRIFAALGIGGVAVAFACKDMVENLISGVIIIFDKPFEVDDCIELNSTVGTVEEIKIRTTRIRTVTGNEIVYPNTTIANAPLINWSRMEKRAFNETLWINYKHSAKEIEEFCNGIREIILSDEEVLKDDVRVNFLEYGTHALEINIFFYVSKTAIAEYQEFKNKFNCQIKEFADSSNAELAFSSQTVYFGNELETKDKK